MSAEITIDLMREVEPIQTQDDMMFAGPGTVRVMLSNDGVVHGTIWMTPDEADGIGRTLVRKAQEAKKLGQSGD